MSDEGRPVRAALRKFHSGYGGRRPDDQAQEKWEAATSRLQVAACMEALDAYFDRRNLSPETGRRIEAYPDEMLMCLADPYKEKLTGHMPRLWARLKADAPRQTGAEEADCQRSAVLFIRACEVPGPLAEALKAELTIVLETLRAGAPQAPAASPRNTPGRPSDERATAAAAELAKVAGGKLPSILAEVQKRNARQLVQRCYAPETVPQLDRTTIARWLRKYARDTDPGQFQPELESAARAHLCLVGMLAEARRYRTVQRNRVRSG